MRIRISYLDSVDSKTAISANRVYFVCHKGSMLIKSISGECIGINVDNGELMDAAEAQIYDHILIKDWQVRLGKIYDVIFIKRMVENSKLNFIS